MNQTTKRLLDSLDDFAVKQLDIELSIINRKIDNRIKRGTDYSELSKEHRKIVTLRKQIMLGV